MPKVNLPENSIHVMITLNPDDGSMTLSSQGNIPETLDPEYAKAMMDISNGLCMILENGVEYLATTGSILTQLEEEMSEEVVLSLMMSFWMPFQTPKLLILARRCIDERSQYKNDLRRSSTGLPN